MLWFTFNTAVALAFVWARVRNIQHQMFMELIPTLGTKA